MYSKWSLKYVVWLKRNTSHLLYLCHTQIVQLLGEYKTNSGWWYHNAHKNKTEGKPVESMITIGGRGFWSFIPQAKTESTPRNLKYEKLFDGGLLHNKPQPPVCGTYAKINALKAGSSQMLAIRVEMLWFVYVVRICCASQCRVSRRAVTSRKRKPSSWLDIILFHLVLFWGARVFFSSIFWCYFRRSTWWHSARRIHSLLEARWSR